MQALVLMHLPFVVTRLEAALAKGRVTYPQPAPAFLAPLERPQPRFLAPKGWCHDSRREAKCNFFFVIPKVRLWHLLTPSDTFCLGQLALGQGFSAWNRGMPNRNLACAIFLRRETLG